MENTIIAATVDHLETLLETMQQGRDIELLKTTIKYWKDEANRAETLVSFAEPNFEFCEWEDKEFDEDNTWYETQCERSFYFSDGSNCEDNKFLFCPYCGKKILTKVHKIL